MSFILRLGGFQQQSLIGIEDGAAAVRLRRKGFKIPRLPGKYAAKGGFTRQFVGNGINHLAILDPDSAGKRAVDDLENGRILREAFQLDDVHEALALHAPKTALAVAPKQGLDAFQKLLDSPARARLLPVQAQ